MIELRWMRPEAGYYDGFAPENAVELEGGARVVLQYREVKTVTQVQGALSTYTTTEWQDVPIQ